VTKKMHYNYSVTINPVNTALNPVEQELGISTGVLTKMTLHFPPGCAGTVNCYLADGPYQLLPQNPDGYYTGDDQVIEGVLR
jgi:hypothetical protein